MSTADGSVLSVTQISGSAPIGRAFTVVLLADGFAASQQGDFNSACTAFTTALLGTAPFNALATAVNVYRVNVASTDSGADDPAVDGGAGTTARTYFDSTFGNGGIRRGLVCDDALALITAATMVPAPNQHVLVVVNSTVYGGSGGAVGTFSLDPRASQIGVHEMGHTAFHLADEYAYLARGAEATRDHHPAGEPDRPNVTLDGDRASTKWRWAIDAATAVPTMANPDCAHEDLRPSPVPTGTVGLFEGADTYHCGAYRPEFDCYMRTLGTPFCRVCRQVITDVVGPLQPVQVGQLTQVLSGDDGVVYAVTDSGDLLWYRHDGQSDGTFRWSAESPRKVGVGWGGLRHVVSGGDGILYAVNDAGALLWYRHDGRGDGSFTWAEGSGSTVGTGWGEMRAVFSGGRGVLYAINPAGDLLWYRHDGRDDGSFRWAPTSGAKVGVGWGGLRAVFSGGDGVLYGIDAVGGLQWYRHDGQSDGTFRWSAASPRQVGTGWGGMRTAFAAAHGIVYAITETGDLLWYRHDGRDDGSFQWAPTSGAKVGVGWTVAGYAVLYAVNEAGDLLWYRHDGRSDGSFTWADGSPSKVGNGWGGVKQLFAGGQGVLYAVDAAGDLQWYRHDGRFDGSFRWADGSPRKVGTGWSGLPRVLTGG